MAVLLILAGAGVGVQLATGWSTCPQRDQCICSLSSNRLAQACCHGDGRCVRMTILRVHSHVKLLLAIHWPASHWLRPGTQLSPASAKASAAQ